MKQFEIQEFDPTLEQVKEVVDQAKEIALRWIQSDEDYNIVKRSRLDLRNMRIAVEKAWKEMRDEANKYAKAVIAKERSYTDLMEEWESVLKKIEKEYDLKLEMEKRRETLPQRLEELKKIWIELTEDQILMMDFDQFNAFIKDKRLEQLEAQELERQKKIDEENRIKKEQEDAAEKKRIAEEAAERSRIETEQRIKKEQEEKERKERERLQAIKDAEEKEKADLEKKRKYNKWLEENNFNAETDKVEKNGNKMIIYRKVSEFLIS